MKDEFNKDADQKTRLIKKEDKRKLFDERFENTENGAELAFNALELKCKLMLINSSKR